MMKINFFLNDHNYLPSNNLKNRRVVVTENMVILVTNDFVPVNRCETIYHHFKYSHIFFTL